MNKLEKQLKKIYTNQIRRAFSTGAHKLSQIACTAPPLQTKIEYSPETNLSQFKKKKHIANRIIVLDGVTRTNDQSNFAVVIFPCT